MRAGTLHHRVYVYIDGTETDEIGTVVDAAAPTNLIPEGLPASIEPLHGKEAEIAAQTHSGVTHKVTTRYYPGITALKSYLVDVATGVRYDIKSIRNINMMNEWFIMLCQETQADV